MLRLQKHRLYSTPAGYFNILVSTVIFRLSTRTWHQGKLYMSVRPSVLYLCLSFVCLSVHQKIHHVMSCLSIDFFLGLA